MTPKERRDRLFKASRPLLRPLQVYDGGKYHNDIAILWAAHQRKPFYALRNEPPTQEAFATFFAGLIEHEDVMLCEDTNRSYKSGSGPIILVSTRNDGWKFEPHAVIFPWTTPRNVLRAYVTFYQMMRNSRRVGCCVGVCLEDAVPFYKHLCEYGVVREVGRIEAGDPRGDEFLFSVKGRKQ